MFQLTTKVLYSAKEDMKLRAKVTSFLLFTVISNGKELMQLICFINKSKFLVIEIVKITE